MFSRQIDPENCKVQRDDQGRFLSVQCNIKNKNICINTLYAPNEDDPLFFVNIFELICAQDAEHIILTGDINKCLGYRKR